MNKQFAREDINRSTFLTLQQKDWLQDFVESFGQTAPSKTSEDRMREVFGDTGNLDFVAMDVLIEGRSLETLDPKIEDLIQDVDPSVFRSRKNDRVFIDKEGFFYAVELFSLVEIDSDPSLSKWQNQFASYEVPKS